MILVQSPRQPLSGNNLVYFLLVAMFFCSCGTSKKVVKSNVPKELPEKNEKVNIISHLPEKVDTLIWTEIKTTPVIKEQDQNDKLKDLADEKIEKSDSFDELNILAMLPMRSDEIDTSERNIPLTNLRFVHYYAGMKMAIERFRQEKSIPVRIQVHDSGDDTQFAEIIKKENEFIPDVLIGPYRIESVKQAAVWAKEQKKIVISPWISSPSITEANPYYFQAKAGLIRHFSRINEHVRAHFPIENIVLISKSKEESRLKLFNIDSFNSSDIKEEIISENDIAVRAEPILEKLLKASGPTVFILPFVSSRDENYVYHFLRRVSAEATNKEVYIYGFYKWIEMKPEILEYINRLNVRLSISNFVDADKNSVKEFKKKYFEKYKEFPSDDAMEAYDLNLYLLRSCNKYGKQFYRFQEADSPDYLETQFIFKPVYKESNGRSGEIEYFENSYIKIVELRDNRYKIVD